MAFSAALSSPLSSSEITGMGSDYSDWTYTMDITINTSADGADVSGDLTDFPLLLRLDGVKFDFTEAAGTGQDIRFSNSADEPLFYEIVRWDSSASLAEIWIRVDNIAGNNGTQFINMYWGNPDAPDSSSPGAVFNSDNGYEGVYHLEETGGTFFDATPNNFDGVDNVSGTDKSGIVGSGQFFDDADDEFNVGSTAGSGNDLTIGMWIRPDNNTSHDWVMAKYPSTGRIGYSILKRDSSENNAIHFRIGSDSDYGGWPDGVMATNMYTASQWSYLAVTFKYNGSNGGTGRIYNNGLERGNATNTGGYLVSETTEDLTFGSKPGYSADYSGHLDEVHVSNVERSPAWIKLSYETQKENSTVVTLGTKILNQVGPLVGFTEDNVIPAGNVIQLPDGRGTVEIVFRVKDPEEDMVQLERVQYNTGPGWNTLDLTSPALANDWNTVSYPSKDDFTGDSNSIRIETGQISELAGKTINNMQFRIRATDGVVGGYAVTEPIVLDNEFPTVNIPRQTTPQRSPRISGTSNEPLLQIQITVNDIDYLGTLVMDSLSFELAAGIVEQLDNGTYTVEVQAIDVWGNESQQAFTDILTVNATAPLVTVTPLITGLESPGLSGMVSDASATVTVTVGGESYGAVVSDTNWAVAAGTFQNLSEGTYDVTAVALAGDVQGVDGTGAELIIDLTPPDIIFENVITNLFNPSFGGTVSEPVDSLRVILNNQNVLASVEGLNWQVTSGPFGGIIEGEYSMVLIAKDVVGNTRTDSSYTMVIDRSNPQLVSAYPDRILTTLLPDLRLEFNENVRSGTGNLKVIASADSSEHQEIAFATAAGQTGNTLIITPGDSLDANTRYHVTVEPTGVSDLAGNLWNGIADSSSWAFTTAGENATFVTSVTSKDTAGIYPIDKVLQLTMHFTDSVTLEGGNLTITLETGNLDTAIVVPPFSLTDSINFSYTVNPGHKSAALNIISLELDNGATLRNSLGGDLVPGIGSGQNLSSSVILGIDGVLLTLDVIQPDNNTLEQNALITYNLSKNIASGSVNWKQVDLKGSLSPEDLIDVTVPFTGEMLGVGYHLNENLNATLTSGKTYDVTFNVTDSAGTTVTVVKTGVQIGETVSGLFITPGLTSTRLNDNIHFQALDIKTDQALSVGVTWQLTGVGTLDSLGNFKATGLGQVNIIARIEGFADTVSFSVSEGSILIPGGSVTVIQAADNLRLQMTEPLTANTVLSFSSISDTLYRDFNLVGLALEFQSFHINSGTVSLKMDPDQLDTTQGSGFGIYQLISTSGPQWTWVPGVLDGDWVSFDVMDTTLGTYIIAQNTIAPVINVVQLLAPVQGEDLSVAYTASSNIGNPEVELRYHEGGNADSLITAIYIETDTLWSVIPGHSVSPNGLVYRFEIKDGTHHVKTVYREVNVTNKNNIPHAGELVRDVYQSFSLPMIHDDKKVETLLMDEWGLEDRAVWRLYHYNGEFHEMVKKSELITGEAYWFKMKNQTPSITIQAGSAESVPLITGNSLTLNEGWNTFANPYLFPVSLYLVESANGVSSLIVYDYPKEGEYNPVDEASNLDPWKGYIIWNGAAGAKLLDELKIVGFISDDPGAKKIKVNRGRELQLSLEGQNSRNGVMSISWNTPGARAEADKMDLPKPGTPARGVSLDLKVPWSKIPYLTDRRGVLGSGQGWTFTARAAEKNERLRLSIKGAGQVEYPNKAVLLDRVRDQVIELVNQEVQTYTYRALDTDPDEFEVLIGTQDYIMQRVSDFNDRSTFAPLGQNFPNPFAASTTILYHVPDAETGLLYNVQMDILNLKGKVVRTLVNAVKAAGRYKVEWNGRSSTNIMLPAGTYVYRLRMGDERIQRKMVLLR